MMRLLRVMGAGSKASAAEAEQELLHLWSGVEKDRAAQLERAALRRRCSVDTPYAASHLVCFGTVPVVV